MLNSWDFLERWDSLTLGLTDAMVGLSMRLTRIPKLIGFAVRAVNDGVALVADVKVYSTILIDVWALASVFAFRSQCKVCLLGFVSTDSDEPSVVASYCGLLVQIVNVRPSAG